MNKDDPPEVRNYTNFRDGCIYHKTSAGNEHDVATKDITITAKLKYVGSILTDNILSRATKLSKKLSETLVEPSYNKRCNVEEDCFCKYNNYNDDRKNPMTEFDEQDRINEIDDKITQLESIFSDINSDLYDSDSESTGTQTTNGSNENVDYTGDNFRQRMVIDEFGTSIGSSQIRFKPGAILIPVVNAAVKSSSVTNNEIIALDKDSNLRSTMLKWD